MSIARVNESTRSRPTFLHEPLGLLREENTVSYFYDDRY